MIVATSFDGTNPEKWFNRALQYGDGLFETIRFQNNQLPLWQFHQQRLTKGLAQLGLKQPDWSSISKTIEAQLAKQQTQSGIFKLTVFRAGNDRGYQSLNDQVEWILSIHHLQSENVPVVLKLGISDIRLSIQPHLAGLKHLSRLEQVIIANQLSEQVDVDDLLVLDNNDRIIETSFQNLVFIKGNQLITPMLNQSGVKGVALSWLALHFNVTKKVLKVEDIKDFDALLVCNAIRGFRFVSSVKYANHVQSFVTSHPVHDKILTQWQLMFNP
jgi:4-amino-4-deoxychorismate lyase